ncbi:Asparaginase [Mycena kentingensis (nom. inval.)]|nr:Asparaginase [Mycena kentingensis (nom. inval.)]
MALVKSYKGPPKLAHGPRSFTQVSTPDRMQLTSFFTGLVISAAAQLAAGQAMVQFSTQLGCPSFSQTFRGSCNFCSDPPGDWSSVLFSGISGNQRVTVHNQDGCTPASQVGQGFGPACWNQGATKLRSAWVACEGQFNSDGSASNQTDKATMTPIEQE